MANAPRYRLYRSFALDGHRTVFSCAQDRQIPVVDGVIIICRDDGDVHQVSHHAALTTEVRTAWNGRPEVAIVQRKTRMVDACSGCGAQVEHDDDGPCCDGASIVQVECLRASALMGTTRRASAGSDADLERLGLRRAS
jgi:hypothetical protein